MLILGINEDHNASAALYKDGVIIGCVSEERFTRRKNQTGYPKLSVEYLLREHQIDPAHDIDKVALAGYTLSAVQMRLQRCTSFTIADYKREQYEYWRPLLYEGNDVPFYENLLQEERFSDPFHQHYDFSFMATTPADQWDDQFQHVRFETITNHLGIPSDSIVLVDHHKAHAAYAYYASDLDRSIPTTVITADSWGDDCNASYGKAENGIITEFNRTTTCNIARIYRWMTLAMNCKPNEHEYKLMGMAPYANEKIWRPAYEMFKETLLVNGTDFRWGVKPKDMYFHFVNQIERNGIRFDGLAAGLQRWTEELLTEWIKNIVQETSSSQLCCAGGLFLNVKANGKLAEMPETHAIFVPPSPGDESLPMGATYFVDQGPAETKTPLATSYLGEAPTNESVEDAIEQFSEKFTFYLLRNVSNAQIAYMLSKDIVLARCCGPMEFGARALGNRSILCNPSKIENIRKINEKIKSRDFWMPFAVTILESRVDDYLVNPKKLKSPYMTLAFHTKPDKRQDIVAGTHPYDFTCRPQILSEKFNPDYYSLIREFEVQTGIGALLNTSFNLHGEPIVRTPMDALKTLMRSGLDGIIFPNVLVLKENL